MTSRRTPALVAVAFAAAAIGGVAPASAGHGTSTIEPQWLSDAQLSAATTVVVGGGADVLATTRTVPHWHGATFDPQDGITYGYNMVGADPNGCVGNGCVSGVDVDITPVDLNVDGMTFAGSDVVGAALASPVFATNDYGTTPFAQGASHSRGPGGVLSQADAGIPLQLQDATMRAEFGKTGPSAYHLLLRPHVLPAVTIDVPRNQAVLLRSGRGVVFPAVNFLWWSAQTSNLLARADPTHLSVVLTDDLFTYLGTSKSFQVFAIGLHGTRVGGPISALSGSANSNGNAAVATFAWATWLTPGLFARPDGGYLWGLQDVAVLSHEVAEWAGDPFADNIVQGWPDLPDQPALGCSRLLETGDPVGDEGFAIGSNTFRQGPNPNGSQSADGFYHPQDEMFMPWYLRLSPNLVSEPTQGPSPSVGRYSLMGDLNTLPGVSTIPGPC